MQLKKKEIERETAEIFLKHYNPLHGTHFEIFELGESPDVICADSETDERLDLEISLLEDLPGDIAFGLGRSRKPNSPTTGTAVVDFFKDAVPNFQKQINKKLLAAYDDKTALVFRQVSILWDAREWSAILPLLKNEVLKGKEANFGAGIWVICTNNDKWPVDDDIFQLSPPTTKGMGRIE
jgi:hypothetical protein